MQKYYISWGTGAPASSELHHPPRSTHLLGGPFSKIVALHTLGTEGRVFIHMGTDTVPFSPLTLAVCPQFVWREEKMTYQLTTAICPLTTGYREMCC